jgi:putative endonuclease
MRRFFVYIIKSDQGYYYIGNTSNLFERLNRHNTNRSRYTAHKGEWEIVLTKECNSKKEAVQLEYKLKSLKNSQKAIEYLSSLV